MDTGNPGGEAFVHAGPMHKNADLQQAKQEEVQGFQRQTFFIEHPALSEKELDQFRWEQEEVVGAFLSEYEARVIKGATSSAPEEQLRVMPKQETVLPMQEEPDEKTLKKRQKQREQKINAGKKKGILAASEYSLDMQKKYSAYMQKKEAAGDRQEKDLEFLKKCVSCFEVTPAIGDPVYVGENPAEAQEYMDNLKEAIDYFTLRNPELLSKMTITFQQKVGSAMKSYPVLEAAYDNALMKNGLKRNGQQLVPIDGNDLLRLRLDEEVRQSLVEQGKKNKEELDAVVAEEVEQYSKKKLAEVQVLKQQVRDEYKAKKGTSFIKTDRITNPYHFDGLDIFATMLEAHPEEYAANKEVLDSIMVYLRNIMETIPIYDSDFSLTDEMPVDIEPEVAEAMHIRQEDTDVKKDNLQTTITMLEMSLKHILEGKPIYDKMAEFLYQFGYASQEYLDAQKKAVDDAKMYGDAYKQKTKIWKKLIGDESEEVRKALEGDSRAFMLMQIEDTEEAHRYNQEILDAKKYTLKAADKTKTQAEREEAQSEIVRIYKPKFQALYNETMNMELESLQNMDPQEIINRQGEFLRIGMENMHLCDCCKQIDPVTGKSIKELVFPSHELEKIYTSKIILIQNYMVMGRMLSMMEAYKKDALTSDMLANETEMQKLDSMRLTGKESDRILEFAKHSYKSAESAVKLGWKLLNDAYIKRGMKFYTGEKTEPSEKHTPRRIEDKISEAVEKVKKTMSGTSEKEVRAAYYKLVQMGRQEEADLIEAEYGLTNNNYHLAGEKKEINEALFRSFGWAESTKGLKDMPEEEFEAIVKLLAAGHLKLSREQMEEADITEQAAMEDMETQADLQAKNKEGLRRLLHAMAPHLDYLEKKYGYEIPQYEYVMAHMEEFHDDFIFCQVTENIVTHFDVLDSNNPEEMRLIHQIHFYNIVGIKAVSLFSQGMLNDEAGGSRLERIRNCRDTVEIAESLDYLKAHPKTAAAGE